MHPDTHPKFWDEWKEPKMPKFLGSDVVDWIEYVTKENPFILLVMMFSAIIGALYFLRWGIRKLMARTRLA